MNFYKDLTRIAKNNLDRYDVNYADLSDDRRIVERWINVQLKLIKAAPRNVIKSTKIAAKQNDTNIRDALTIIETKFKNGADVNPHLSKRIFRKDYTDCLFSDWGIYHLHLSTTIDGKYFMKGSDWLLFAIIDRQDVYFVDIRPHDEQYVFAQKELLKIIHDEWPHILEPYRLRGITAGSAEVNNPEEIDKLRKGGVCVIQFIEDRCYAPMGGGITTAGTSGKVTIEVDNLYRMAKNAMKFVENHKQEFIAKIASALGQVPAAIDFHLELTEIGFIVVEANSKCRF